MYNLITVEQPKSHVSEAYRAIRTSIEFSNLDNKVSVISVTSSKKGEGKTTIISNLAVLFANLDKKVLLLDGDLRMPSIHRLFGLSKFNGLIDVLLGRSTFAQCVNCTEIKNLHILTSGDIPPNPSEVLASKKMREFINSLRDEYDYIFIDLPPIGLVTDAGIVSLYSDGSIFVVAANEVDIDDVRLSIKKLERVGANIIGSILNKYEVKKLVNEYY